jgi:hypothetical protein
MSEDKEVYIVNLDSPVIAHMRFYWFISLLESGADTQSAKSETEEYFRQMKHYIVPILIDISMAKSYAMIACQFSIAACQMFANNTSKKILCIYNVKGEGDASREAWYDSRVENIRYGCIVVSMKE